MKKIAIFGSGTGTNAKKIIDHFNKDPDVKVTLIASNKKSSGIVGIAKEEEIPAIILNREEFYNSTSILTYLRDIDLIVLAGFLWFVPEYLVQAFPRRMINLHPALLPRFGGEGMYGMNVHRAVLESGDKKTGITIHYVNEKYDEGEVIFQAECDISECQTPEEVAGKVRELEHKYLPLKIKEILSHKR